MAETLEEMKAQLAEIEEAQTLTADHLSTLNTAVSGITTDLAAIKVLVTELKDHGPAVLMQLEEAVTAVHEKAQALATTTESIAATASEADAAGDEIRFPEREPS